MAGPFDFTGQKIQDTYGRVVQLVTGSLYDGTGKLINSTIQDIADTSNQRQSESIELSAISSSVVELQHFSSSLDADFATDAELSALSSSILVTTNNLADDIDENEEELDNQGTRIATLTAATSSYVTFPYTGSAVISGSLEIDGGTFISGGLNAHGTLSSFQYPLTITPEGTLGLGTNSPRNDSAVTVGGRMTFTTSNLIQMRSIPSTGGNIIRFGPSAASQGFIKGQEGFGIGTSNGSGGPGAWEVWGKGGGGEIVKTSWSSSYAAYHGTHAYNTGISRPFHLITSGNLNQIVLHTGSFVGIGLEDPQTNLHVSGAVSASTYYGDGSNLTGIETDPFPYTGSAVISGSLEVIGDTTVSGKLELNTPNNNVIVGYQAGQNDPSNQNVFVGYQAGQNVTAGKHVAIGYQAGRQMTSIQNIAIGHLAGGSGGAYNVTIGADARRNSAGQANISIGHAAFRGHGSNNNAIGIGYAVGRFGGGTGAVLLGYQAGYSLSGDYNIGLGHNVGYDLTGEYNTVLGYESGYYASGSKNVILGYQAGYNLTGSNQLIIANNGSSALITGDFAEEILHISGTLSLNDGSNNTVIGEDAGDTTSRTFATYVGYQAGQNASNSGVTAIGYQAGGGLYHTAIGYQAGNAGGGYKETIGHGSGGQGHYSTTIGFQAGKVNGVSNLAIGHRALGTSGNASSNIAIGKSAIGLMGNFIHNNIAIGMAAGANLQAQASLYTTNNIIIGDEAGRYLSGSRNIVIGNEAGYNHVGNDMLIISNTGSKALITGDFAKETLHISGTILATTGSFSHLKGNSPITVQDPVIFQHNQGLDVLGNATIHSINEVELQTISKDFNYTSSLNVTEITSSVEGAIIDYRLTRLDSGSRVGTFMYAHDGTTLSYNDTTIPGAGLGDEPTLSATLNTGSSIVSIDIENAAGFNFTGYAKKFSKLDNPVPIPDPNTTYPLDTYTGAALALSVRQVIDPIVAYTGSCMKVREDGSNTEADIGFGVDGLLDTSALALHCGSNNGYIVTWYDQSGNNRNATQSTVSRQPKIYDSATGVLKNSNNIPYAKSNAINGVNDGHLELPSSTPFGSVYFTGLKSNTDDCISSLDWNLPSGGARIKANNVNFFFNEVNIENQDTIIGGIINGSNSRITANQETAFGTVNSIPNQQIIFGRGDGSRGLNKIYELIVWNTAQTVANHEGLIEEQNNYYNMFTPPPEGLLEDYPGAQFAYSVRQLTTAATSSMEIRRASDNTETTIGFALNGNLNTSSIETFCNGTECVVVKWYDQSGNGNDAAQSSALFQPTIYSGSTVITFNGIPTPTNLYYNYNDRFNITNSLGGVPASGSFTVSYVNNLYNAGGTAFNVISGIADRTDRLITYMPGYASINGTYSRSPDHADHAIVYRKSGSEANTQGAYHNGSFQTENNNNGQAAYNPGTWSFPSQTSTYMHEIIFWPTNLSGSGATDIMDNVNSYFNIY